MPILLELFLTFAKIGLFTFGGGYAMISLIEDVCVDRRGWITHDEMMDITVIAESTPGPIAINCATFVGYRRGGVLGAVLATFGVVLPSFVIIFLIAQVLDNFLAIPLIAHAFGGIKLAVGLLILDAQDEKEAAAPADSAPFVCRHAGRQPLCLEFFVRYADAGRRCGRSGLFPRRGRGQARGR